MAKLAPESCMAVRTAVVLLFWPQSPAAPKEKVDPGPGVGVGPVGVGVGPVGVGVGVSPPPPQLTRNSTRFVEASLELKSYPSVFPVASSMPSDMSEPAPAATAEVMSTSIQAFTVDGAKVVMIPPFAGRVFQFIAVSPHVVSATLLMFSTPVDEPTTHIRNVACVIGSPASEVRSNFR